MVFNGHYNFFSIIIMLKNRVEIDKCMYYNNMDRDFFATVFVSGEEIEHFLLLFPSVPLSSPSASSS